MEQTGDIYLHFLIEALNTHIVTGKKTSQRYNSDLQNVAKKFLNTHTIPSSIAKASLIEVNELDILLNNLFQSKRSQNAYTRSFHTVNDNFNRILRNFQQYKKSYTDISNRILSRLTSVEQIHSIINQMKVIAREIKLFSINSVIVASQAGRQGVGFKSISRFIIELSDTIQKSALQLENYRDKILHIRENLKVQFEILINGIYEEKIIDIQNTTQNSVIWAAEDMEVIMKIVNELVTRIKTIIDVGEKKAAPYLTGQNRIVSVYLISIAMSAINDVEIMKGKNISKEEIGVLLSAIKYIQQDSGPVFTEALSTVAAYRNSLFTNYSEFLKSFGMAQQDQMYILNYLSVDGEHEKSLFEQIFAGIKQNIKNFQNLLVEEGKVKETLLDNFLEIEKLHQEGLAIFANFEKFFTTMNNINILAQIEISKNNFESINNINLKNKFNVMLTNIEAFNNDIKNHIKKMLANLMLEMDKFTDLQLEQSSLLRNTDTYLDSEIGNLDFAQLMLSKQIHTIRDENPKIFNTESSLKSGLTSIDKETHDFVEKLRETTEQLSFTLEGFDNIIRTYSLQIPISFENNPLIERYKKSRDNILTDIGSKAVKINKEGA